MKTASLFLKKKLDKNIKEFYDKSSSEIQNILKDNYGYESKKRLSDSKKDNELLNDISWFHYISTHTLIYDILIELSSICLNLELFPSEYTVSGFLVYTFHHVKPDESMISGIIIYPANVQLLFLFSLIFPISSSALS